MAAKEVQKEAKKEVVKKGRRRLKRSVRKTLGALFLASSIAIAAIPTEGLQAAATPNNWGTLEENMPGQSRIPKVTNSDRIYTTGEGRFQFAYKLAGDNSTDWIAVIVGYDKTSTVEGGRLVIPDTVDAYAKLSYNEGTGSGYCAISETGYFLYYKVEVWDKRQVYEEDGFTPKKDADGNPIMEDYIRETYYNPCYYADRANWQNLGMSEFYYFPKGNPKDLDDANITDQSNEQWIKGIQVRYIGNEYVVASTVSDNNTTNNWVVAGTVNYNSKDNGIFAGAGNIDVLVFGEKLSGVGDYAFYNCTNLDEVTFGNGLNTIGVGAFARCINMYSVNIDAHPMIQVIGDYAFYDCQALRTFTVPNTVNRLGDSVFEGCIAMTACNLTTFDKDGEPENVQLSQIGSRLFAGCEALESLTFPRNFTNGNGIVPLSTFTGCTSLKYIEVPKNTTLTFEGDSNMTFDQFKQTVPATFYFKGVKDSALHKTATKQEIAFSFFDDELQKDVYELTVSGEGASGTNKQIVYRVDEDDNLVFFGTNDGTMLDVKEVILPEQIGPRHILVIDTRAFQRNCYIEKITIPASIREIEESAFMGCHNLKYVLFTDPAGLKSIGKGAFKTQNGTAHDTKCTDTVPDPVPELYFVGPISYSSQPFLYAMDPSENINSGTQQDGTYITYYSGWPTHLEVKYNPATDKNELINYPTLNDIKSGTYTKEKYPYMTDDYVKSMNSAWGSYQSNPNGLTGYEKQIIDAALNIHLPDGIESIKENLFIDNEKEDLAAGVKGLKKTITADSLHEVAAGTFKEHPYLVSVTLGEATTSIGDHAFEGCEKLVDVNLPATVKAMGNRPFAGCSELEYVNFNGGPYFTCDNSIIYKLNTETGAKDILVEVLEGRLDVMVTAEETAGITAIYPEAFQGTDMVTVDLSRTNVERIESDTFADTPSLTRVILPSSVRSIRENAFKNSGVRILQIAGQNTNIDNNIFGADADKEKLKKQVQFIVEEGSMAEDWADMNGFRYSYQLPEIYYTVRFYDGDGELIGEPQQVLMGESAEEPEHPKKDGYVFVRWSTNAWKAVMEDLMVNAVFEKEDQVYYTITYYNDDFSVYLTQEVRSGYDAIVPNSPPSKNNPGAEFQGWVIFGGDKSGQAPVWTNIRSDMSVIAVYKGSGGNPGASGSPNPNDPNASGSPNPNDPNASGSPNPNNPNASGSPNPNNPNASGSPNPNNPNTSGSPNPNDPNASGSPGPGGSNTLYTLTVQNGSGSGSYVEGAQPVIIANDPASGQEFDHWSVSPADVKIASLVLSASVITMPAQDVTVTAHYKVKSGGSGNTGSGNNSQRPNGNVNSVTKNGTTVVIDKNGLSNTGVVSATVHGSSDNFTIKITDTTEATEAALRALMNEYGNLDNIKYFPMDISLYDSTGTNKITDTTGLSVSITLPLPDSLITYAGNNKVASTLNDRLEKLSARFTTIQGVSCVTFTAEHFSPYVIYVDTGDLSSGLVSDSTPKTGDGIHPKWFLSIGLACLSFVFFMQKDTKRQKKVKVKARA